MRAQQGISSAIFQMSNTGDLLTFIVVNCVTQGISLETSPLHLPARRFSDPHFAEAHDVKLFD